MCVVHLCKCGCCFFGLFGCVTFTLVYVGANVPQIVLDGQLEIHDIVMFISCINFVLSDNVNLASLNINKYLNNVCIFRRKKTINSVPLVFMLNSRG